MSQVHALYMSIHIILNVMYLTIDGQTFDYAIALSSDMMIRINLYTLDFLY